MSDQKEQGEEFEPRPPAGTPTHVRRIITVGGGRGGVGKSLLAVNLGVYLAQLGREVIVVDTDFAGSSLYIQLGLEHAPFAAKEAVESLRVEPVVTPVPGLRLFPSAHDPGTNAPFRPGRKVRWMNGLRLLPADYILMHLGSGTSPITLDLFLSSDVGICVTVPDPAAIESTYRFLRALYLRQLRRALIKDRFRLRMLERALNQLGPLPSPLEVLEAITRHDASLAELAATHMRRIRPRLVVNQSRLRADLELGPAMEAMAERYLGLRVEYVGHVEQDDQAWLTARRRRPLLVDSPTAKSARNLERIARRVVALATTADPRTSEPPRLPPERRTTLYDVLGISRGASDEEVRRAYKRQRELFAPGSLPLVSLVDEAQMRAELTLIQEAYDTILDPVRRGAYNISTFPEAETNEKPGTELGRRGLLELLGLQTELAREVHPETEFTGELVRRIRESQGIELSDIAARTKITMAHLTALEAERYDELPAEVYVRGFLQLIARQLQLDAAQVVRTYIRRMRDALAARAHD